MVNKSIQVIPSTSVQGLTTTESKVLNTSTVAQIFSFSSDNFFRGRQYYLSMLFIYRNNVEGLKE